jgi:hypothetical protein
LKYPSYYFRNDHGKIEIDKNNIHPYIHYYGTFNQTKKMMHGTWEITLPYEEYMDGDVVEIINREFQMTRIG